jgi:hypothetical protein
MIPLKWVTLGWVGVMAVGFAFCLYDLYQPLLQLALGAVVSRLLPAMLLVFAVMPTTSALQYLALAAAALYLWLVGFVCLRAAASAWLARPAASP